jgi:hypothetical protein
MGFAYLHRSEGVGTCMGWRKREHLVPTATPAFRLKSWRAFQIALDPLARPRVFPRGRRPHDDDPLSVDVIAALTHG